MNYGKIMRLNYSLLLQNLHILLIQIVVFLRTMGTLLGTIFMI